MTTAQHLRHLADKYEPLGQVLYVDADRGGRPVRVSDLLRNEAAELEAGSPP